MAILHAFVARRRRELGVGRDVEHGEKPQWQAPNPSEDHDSTFASEHASIYNGDEDEHDENQELQDVDKELERQTRLRGIPYVLSKAFDRFLHVLRRIWRFLFSHPDDAHEHVPVYRWLPIVSGIVIPFSILLEIPGLTEHWYVRTVDNQIVDIRKNGALLDAGLGISMACAVLANIALMVRFLETHIKTMTLVSICCLTLHDLINLVAIILFGIRHRHPDGFTYGQSYWFTVCSTVASTFTNLTLVYDHWSTKDFASSGSGLTRRQRSLVIIVMILMGWVALGGLFNSMIMQLSFIDGLYFSVVTIETVGFGDIVPQTAGARVFTGFYSVIGILNLAVAVSTTRDTIIESFEHSYKTSLSRLKEMRREHRQHKALLKAQKAAFKQCLERQGLQVYVTKRHARGVKMKLNVDALSPEQRDEAMKYAETYVQEHGNDTGARKMRPRTHSFMSETHYIKKLSSEMKRNVTAKTSFVWILFLSFWMIGAVIFMVTENWSFGLAVWFCFETFSTIGYGDITPKTPAGRAIFIVWALLGVGAMTILISVLTEAYSSRYNLAIEGHENGASSAASHGVPLTATNTMATDDFAFSPTSPISHVIGNGNGNGNGGGIGRRSDPAVPEPFVPARNPTDGGNTGRSESEDSGDISSTYSLSRDGSSVSSTVPGLSTVRQREVGNGRTPSSPLAKEVLQD